MDNRSLPEVSNNSRLTQDSGYHTQVSSADDQELFNGNRSYAQPGSGHSGGFVNQLDARKSLIPYTSVHTLSPNFGNPGLGDENPTFALNQGHLQYETSPFSGIGSVGQFPGQSWGLQTNLSLSERFNGPSIPSIPDHSRAQEFNLSGYRSHGQYIPPNMPSDIPTNVQDCLRSSVQPSSSSSTSNAETWVKFWIAQNPRKFPSDRDRELLASTAKESYDVLEQAFAKILSSGAVQEQGSENRGSFSTVKVANQLINRGQSLIIDPQYPRAAAQWVASQETSCPSWQDDIVPGEETRSWTYKCTLGCGRPFEKKDGWVSHEKLRFPQSGWVCGLDKIVVIDDITYCSYCGLQDPQPDHFEDEHSDSVVVGACCENLVGRGRHRTIFDRQYRFLEHLKQVHPNLPLPQGKILAQSYFTVPPTFDRICSICSEYEFRDWDDRIRHLARHSEGPRRFPKHKRPPNDDDNNGDDDDDPKDDGDHFDDSSRPPDKRIRRGNDTRTSKGSRQNSDRSGGPIDNESMQRASLETIARRYKPSSTSVSLCYDTLHAMKTIPTSDRLFISSFKKHLLDDRVSWADTNSRSFVPQDRLESICTKENILEEICMGDRCGARCEEEELIEYIQKSAKKTFAILAFIGQSHKIEAFMRENLSDANLPVPVKESSSVENVSGPSSIYQILLQLLTKRGVDEFYQHQWSFLAPIFTFKSNVTHYELDNNCILPFVQDVDDSGESKHEGGFGTVFRIKIHPAHQKTYNARDQEVVTYNQLFAIKQLKSNDAESFKAEVAMLKQLSGSNHSHLIKLLATYQFQGKNHFIFPWADGSLSAYLQKKGPPATFSDSLWFLEQLKGLASGLAAIHCSHRISPGLEEPKYGIHLDLKPDNILCFANEKGCGIWKIADFGISKLRERDSRSRIDPASIAYTPAYAAPEIALKQPISRAYDIWSFGCVLTQCLAWYIAGYTAVDDLMRSQMQSSNPKEQGLFKILEPSDGSQPHAIIKESVPRLIQQLRIHPRSSEFVQDMLTLIEKDLLIIDPKRRLSATAIEQILGRMVERAKHSATYMSSSPVSEKEAEPDGRSLNLKPDQRRSLEKYSKKISQGFKSIKSLVSTRSGNRGSINGVHQSSP